MPDSFKYTFVDSKLAWSVGSSYNYLSFSSDGLTLAGATAVGTSGYPNGKVQFWDTVNGAATSSADGWSFIALSHSDPNMAAVIGPVQGVQLIKRDPQSRTWSPTGSVNSSFKPDCTAAFMHDGKHITLSQHGKTFWRVIVDSFSAQDGYFSPPVNATTFVHSPNNDSNTIVFGGVDGQVQARAYVDSSSTSTLLCTFSRAGTARVSACAWSVDQRWIAMGDDLGDVRLWNATTMTMLYEHELPRSAAGPILSLVFVPDSTALVILSGSVLAVWDLFKVQYVSNSGLPINAKSIALDGPRNRLAVVGLDERVTIYELKPSEEPPRRKPKKGSNEIPPELVPFDISKDVVKSKPDPYDGLYFDIYRGAWKLDKPRIFQHVVAIKALRPRFNPNSKTQERQDFEDLLTKCIKSWLDLSHANLVPLLGVSMNFGNFPAMVTSWMINGLLSEYVKSDEEYDELQLVLDVATGVEYLHSNNIVHSDIRASSFLVDELGVARLADPGLLNVLVDSPLMKSGNISLPYRWMAPELINKSVNKANTSTDVYSVTMTSLEILTKKPPYQGVDDALVPSQILQGQRPSRPDDVEDGLWSLWGEGWNQDASRRPNMASYVQRLKQLAD